MRDDREDIRLMDCYWAGGNGWNVLCEHIKLLRECSALIVQRRKMLDPWEKECEVARSSGWRGWSAPRELDGMK